MSNNTVWREGYAWAASRVVDERTSASEFLGHFRFKRDANKATEHSGHEIRVYREKAGGYPIAGWNWPKWKFTVSCSCGYEAKNVGGMTKEFVQGHLERLDPVFVEGS